MSELLRRLRLLKKKAPHNNVLLIFHPNMEYILINLITLIDHLIENEPDVAAFGMNVKKSYTLTNTYYYKSIYLFLFKPYFLKVEIQATMYIFFHSS